MKYVIVNGHRVYFDTSREQIDKNGRQFRYSGVRKNTQMPYRLKNPSGKWVYRPERGVKCTEHYHWMHSFRYLDNDTFFEVETGYNDEFIGLIVKSGENVCADC